MNEFTVEYFIAKFEAIPEEKWCTRFFEQQGQRCALGHCGMTDVGSTDEAGALINLFGTVGMSVTEINDDHPVMKGPTPKQRVLAALRDLQKKL